MFRISRRYAVWKLQRPLATNMPVQEVMAYQKGHKSLALIPMTDYEIDDIFGNEDKVYVLARVVDGILHVKKRLGEQSW